MLADRLEREAIERGTVGMYSLKLHQGEAVMVKRWVADPSAARWWRMGIETI